jgi:AbiU2
VMPKKAYSASSSNALNGKFDRLVGEIRRISRVHELNKYFSYSRSIVEKVNKSSASNAYITLQNELRASEISGVCRIWDKHGSDRCSLPSLIVLAKNECFQRYFDSDVLPTFAHKNFTSNPAGRWQELAQIAHEVDETVSGPLYLRVRDYRDEHLAHILQRQESDSIATSHQDEKIRYGDEADLFKLAKVLTVRLSRVLTDGYVSFEPSDENNHREAKLFADSIDFKTHEQLWQQAKSTKSL